MRFLRLQLTNIGAFYGNYDFNLETSQAGKNVILFGGQNGSGKTTILESIRLALFGPLAFGHKTSSPAYLDKIQARLNNSARDKGETNYRIILDLELTEKLSVNRYTINRSWKSSRTGLHEELLIQRNNDFLNAREMELFQEKIREETPPKLLELCLFDGEQISGVVANDTLPEYISGAARVLFNLDLFEYLNQDLDSLVKQENIYRSLDKEEKELQQLIEQRQEAEEELNSLYTRVTDLGVAIEEDTSRLRDLNRQFEVYGGLQKEQRDELLSQIRDTDHRRLQLMETTKAYITDLLPFQLVSGLLTETQEQIQLEWEFDLHQRISETVNDSVVLKALTALRATGALYLEDELDVVAYALREHLLPQALDDVKVIHQASFHERASIESLLKKVTETNIDEIRDSFKHNNKMIKRVQQLRAKLDENDSSSDIRDIVDQIQEIRKNIEKLETTQQETEDALEAKVAETNNISSKIEELREDLIKSRKAQNVFSIIQQVKLVSDDFKYLQLKKKLRRVESLLCSMMQDLFRKELFITNATIDPTNFDLKLYGPDGDELNKERLSAGEKHLVLLSTIWAMVQCSNRQIPFVFDTLLGRLDQKHKKRIIDRLIPSCGEQVIVLATDSEIDQEHFSRIKPQVSKAYTIDHQVNLSRVQVTEDTYFEHAIH